MTTPWTTPWFRYGKHEFQVTSHHGFPMFFAALISGVIQCPKEVFDSFNKEDMPYLPYPGCNFTAPAIGVRELDMAMCAAGYRHAARFKRFLVSVVFPYFFGTPMPKHKLSDAEVQLEWNVRIAEAVVLKAANGGDKAARTDAEQVELLNARQFLALRAVRMRQEQLANRVQREAEEERKAMARMDAL